MIGREQVLGCWVDEDSIKTGDLVRVDWTMKEFKDCCSRGNRSPDNGGCPNIYYGALNNMFSYCKNKLALVVEMTASSSLKHYQACSERNAAKTTRTDYYWEDRIGWLNKKWVYQCGCINDIIYGVQPIGKREIYYVDRVAIENGMSRVSSPPPKFKKGRTFGYQPSRV